MVAVFLAAEVTSERYGPQIREILTGLGQPLSVVERPVYERRGRQHRAAPIILLSEPGPANLIVIEGHKRLTGLLLCPQWLPAELEVLLGITARHDK